MACDEVDELEREIAANERGLRGPVAGDPYWKGRLNGLHFGLTLAKHHDCIPLDDVKEVAQQ